MSHWTARRCMLATLPSTFGTGTCGDETLEIGVSFRSLALAMPSFSVMPMKTGPVAPCGE